MNELIKITTDGQGSSVVSARDLYTFLEIKKQFADWIKNRIDKYGLVEGQDYTTFSLIGEKGRPTVEYALTLDAAKELAMVEGNAKGKQARQYFIEAEKALRQLTEAAQPPAPSISSAQQLLAQAQLLVSHEQRLETLEMKVAQLLLQQRQGLRDHLEGNAPQPPPLFSTLPLGAELPLRQKIVRLVNLYCEQWQISHQTVWSRVYNRLYALYGFNVHFKPRRVGESLLDVAERHGQLDHLYAIVSAEYYHPGGETEQP